MNQKNELSSGYRITATSAQAASPIATSAVMGSGPRNTAADQTSRKPPSSSGTGCGIQRAWSSDTRCHIAVAIMPSGREASYGSTAHSGSGKPRRRSGRSGNADPNESA